MGSLADSLAFLKGQTGFAILGMVTFMAGAASAGIVVHYRIGPLMRFPLWLLKWVMKLMGRRPSMGRLFVIIFVFNSVAMFLYMCTGVWVIGPALVGFLTGMNLAIVFVCGRPMLPPEAVESEDPAPAEDDAEPATPGLVPLLCGLLVLVLELPAFWYATGMGISLGRHVRDHFSLAQIVFMHYGEGGLGGELAVRAAAYGRVIVPVLALSAWAEAYAVAETSRMVGPDDAESDSD